MVVIDKVYVDLKALRLAALSFIKDEKGVSLDKIDWPGFLRLIGLPEESIREVHVELVNEKTISNSHFLIWILKHSGVVKNVNCDSK